jgi:predicted lipoprotein with Yx(FWY)xxD motif
MRNRWWAAPVLAGGAALLAACGSSAAPSTSGSTAPASSGGSSAPATQQSGTRAGAITIGTHSTSVGTVLTNAQGKTLYWFAIDTPTMSKCTGSCATFWPPVIGKPAAAAGSSLPHGFGTITRSDGQVQATYDGHPLYTYMGDSSPGQVSGNGLNASGGLWWAMTPTGAKPAKATAGSSPSSSSSSSSGSGGW